MKSGWEQAVGTVGVIGLILWSVGCASGVKNPSGVPVTELRPDEQGFVAGTGIESQDIVTMADRMARSILSVPQVAQAKRPPRIVLQPIINESRFPINKDLLLTKLETLLIERGQGKVVFLARERWKELQQEAQLKRSGQVTSEGPVAAFQGADYFLTGKIQSLTTRTSAGLSDYIQVVFQLIDARTSEIVWAGSYEVKRQGLEDAVYR